MSTRHQAKRRREYGPRRHELLERRVRVTDRGRAEQAPMSDAAAVEARVAFRPLILPPPMPSMGD